jgi:nifR3 family TIM-barrel protein
MIILMNRSEDQGFDPRAVLSGRRDRRQGWLKKLPAMLTRPLFIGGRCIANRLVLAPMTFLGHVAFRELVGEFGGFGLLWTEMCSSRALPGENPRVSDYFRWREKELPHLVCQLLGADPRQMAKAARRVEREGFFGVDLNFGCSASAICKQHCGAALLRDPDRAADIVTAVRRSVRIPLFVKYRTGWTDAPDAAVDLAKRFERAGADALVFHPRVAPDRRNRPPRWDYIGRVKAAVSIPVFGNGNVFTAGDCLALLEQTGCDGVSLGRIAAARPWSFAQWSTGLVPWPDIHRQAAFRLADLMEDHFEPGRALRRYKKFAMYFSANFAFGHTLFTRLRNAADMEQIRKELTVFFDGRPEILPRPNLNFFV